MEKKLALVQYTLRLGDDALILGHRLSEWCSRGPILEEDLALTNLSLDMIGRAQALLKYAAEIEQQGRSEDELAYRREEREYRNHLLCEVPNTDFAYTMARQFLISVYEFYFYTRLQTSADSTLAAIAAKTLKEVKYHLAHAGDWIIRLGDGTEESHGRMQRAIDDLWMYTGELFEMNEAEGALLADGVAVDLAPLHAAWYAHVKKIFDEATLQVPSGGYMQRGGLRGRHTEHMGHLLAEMQYLQRAYPDAKW